MSYEKLLNLKGDIEDFILEEAQKLALDIDREVVMETPVDSGAAHGSWLASVGSPDDSDVKNKSPSVAIEQGQRAIGSAKVYQLIYIQNTKPYIHRLNEGWSQKAPAKYIDSIIIRNVNK